MENVHASKHIKSLTGTPEKLNKSLVDQCRWHKDMVIPAHFLTWRAASSILLQSEFWKTRTLVGPHGVDAQMLTEFPTIEQTFIQVVSRKVIWQFGFITDGQSFIVIFCLWNYKRTTLAGSLTGVLALGLYSMELFSRKLQIQPKLPKRVTPRTRETHPEDKTIVLKVWRDRHFTGATATEGDPGSCDTNATAIVLWTNVPHWSSIWIGLTEEAPWIFNFRRKSYPVGLETLFNTTIHLLATSVVSITNTLGHSEQWHGCPNLDTGKGTIPVIYWQDFLQY